MLEISLLFKLHLNDSVGAYNIPHY